MLEGPLSLGPGSVPEQAPSRGCNSRCYTVKKELLLSRIVWVSLFCCPLHTGFPVQESGSKSELSVPSENQRNCISISTKQHKIQSSMKNRPSRHIPTFADLSGEEKKKKRLKGLPLIPAAFAETRPTEICWLWCQWHRRLSPLQSPDGPRIKSTESPL